jgi:fumarate hydratase class II
MSDMRKETDSLGVVEVPADKLCMTNFRKFLIEGTEPNLKKINEYVERSLMLVTALVPVIGYDKASKIAHYALDHVASAA